MTRPIEIGDTDAFEVRLAYPSPRRDAMEHRFRAKKALDMEDKEVPAEDLEALRWVREKRGVIEDGKSYTISKYNDILQVPYKENVPERPVTVEIPTFAFGADGNAVGRGRTLREAVESVKSAIRDLEPGDTYPGRNAGLDRVLLEVGSAEVTVSTVCSLIRDYWDDDHGEGGTLHCALADGNMLDRDIDWEIKHAREKGDGQALLIAELLRIVPEDDRKRLWDRGFGK